MPPKLAYTLYTLYIYKLKYETAIIHSLHRYIHQSDFKYGKV